MSKLLQLAILLDAQRTTLAKEFATPRTETVREDMFAGVFGNVQPEKRDTEINIPAPPALPCFPKWL